MEEREARDLPKRRWARVAVWVGAGGFVVLCLAWLSFPAWAPVAAARFLPEGWRLEEARLGYPTLAGVDVDAVNLRGTVAGLAIDLRITDAQASPEGPSLRVSRATVTLTPVSGAVPEAAPGTDARLADFTLPRLIMSGSYPVVAVDHLEVVYEGSQPAQRWVFQNLAFDETSGDLQLTATVASPPGLRDPVRLALLMNRTRLDFEARPTGPTTATDGPPLLHYAERAPSEEGGPAEAKLEMRLDLAGLDPEALSPSSVRAGLGPTATLEGTLAAVVTFQGQESLEPRHAELQLEATRWRGEAAHLDADLDLAVVREGDRASVTVRDLALDFTGDLPAIPAALVAGAEAFGIRGLFAPGPFSLGLNDAEPGAGAGAALNLDLDLTREPLDAIGRVAGDLALYWSQAGGVVADLALSGLEADVSTRTTPTWEATLTGTVRSERPVSLGLDEATLSASTLSLALDRLDLRSGDAFAVEGRLGASQFDGVAFVNPSVALRLGALGLQGEVRQGPAGFGFQGPVTGSELAVAPFDAVIASNLLTARSLAFELDMATPTGATTEFAEVRGKGALEGIALPDLGVRLDRSDLEIRGLSLPSATGPIAILTTGLEAQLGDTLHGGLDLDVSGDLVDGSRYSGAGELLLGYSASLPLSFDVDLDRAAVRVTLDQAPLPAGGFAAAARALAVPLPEGLAFRDGQLVLDGTLSADASGVAGDLGLKGEALSMSLGESLFEGLFFETRLSLADVLSGRGPLALDLARLAAGLDLVSLSTDLDIRSTTDFGALDLEASLLGGRLSAPVLRLADGRLEDALIQWEGFDLGRLLTFLDVNGISGTGTMDASFPVTSTPEGVAVRDGRFSARGPGRLAYDSGGPATNIGLQALENFRYDSLEGTVNYGADGAYTIGLDLLGRNPDLYGGHPIRFRLNLGGAMPALFRSLFLTGDFEEAIIDRLRAGESPLEETPPVEDP